MAQDDAPRAVWPPEPGFFRLRLVRRGWAVPARIIHDETGWRSVIDGVEGQPAPDPVHAGGVAQVWHGGRVIDEAEYSYLNATREWAAANQPDHPCLHPRRPITPQLLRPFTR